MTPMKLTNYRESLLKRLKSRIYAVGYLTNVLAHETPEAFLIALKDVVEARGENITSLAEEAGITRQALYQALSKNGNPRFSTITQILKALDLRFSGLTALSSEKEAA